MKIAESLLPQSPDDTLKPAGQLETAPHPYDVWLRKEGVITYRGYAVDDLKTIAVVPWERIGGLGAVIRFVGSGYINDARVIEIPPRKSLKPQKQLYEECVYIVSGIGATQLWYDGQPKQVVEWQRQSLLVIPPNVNYQHFNADPHYPVRYFSTTTAPLLFDIFGNEDFIFNCDFRFYDRYTGYSEDYSTQAKGWVRKEWPPQIWETNFVPNVAAFDKLLPFEGRGKGNKGVLFKLANGRAMVHMAEFPEGTYKKAHRHGPAANVITVFGRGYSLLWEGEKEKQGVLNKAIKIDWHEDSVLVPPEGWWHQHFSTNNGSTRYLPVHAPGVLGSKEESSPQEGMKGKNQIDYSEEDPEIFELFVKEIAKTGAKLDERMSMARKA